MIASLSEGWRSAQNDLVFIVTISIYFSLIGPFWIIFNSGVDTLLGILWLAVDIAIVLRIWSASRKALSRHENNNSPQGYLKTCLAGTASLVLPPAAWILVNFAIIATWNHFHKT